MKNNKRAINLSSWEDITAYDFGEYISSGSRWINFGKFNDYPSYLRNLYLSSPTNQAVIDGTTNLATGEGVEVVDPAKNPISTKYLNDNFPKDVVKKLLGDLKLYGYCTVQVYSGSIIKYSDAIKYRFDADKENFVWFSNDWNYYTYSRNKPVKLPRYKEGCDDDISILLIQMDTKGFLYYSPVDYNASINYISLEAEISKYHLSNIKNGLFPGLSITFIGTEETSDEQMDKIERDLNKKWGGSNGTGRAMISAVATKDDAPIIVPIEQSSLPETYQFLTKEASEKILIGHGVTSPLLFGIRDTGGGLGSNAQELEQSFYLYYESKLKHYQNYILELINKVMNGNLLYASVQFVTYNPFKNIATTPSAAPSKLSKITNVNEIDSQVHLSKLDEYKYKPEGILIGEKIFTTLNEKALYKFVKSSNNNNIINKKFEILDRKGYVFKPNDMIKNTKDYFFMEQIYLAKTITE